MTMPDDNDPFSLIEPALEFQVKTWFEQSVAFAMAYKHKREIRPAELYAEMNSILDPIRGNRDINSDLTVGDARRIYYATIRYMNDSGMMSDTG